MARRASAGARPGRRRIDVLLVERGLAPSRQRAQALVLAGVVVAGDHAVEKPGMEVAIDVALRLKGEPLPYVSRGGLKLVHALDRFAIDVAGRDALDVGASTGGFTDVLLQRGAPRVCAVDVGHGQLAWKLRQDARVVVQEGVNARHLDPATLPFAPQIVVCDVSFISLELVLPRLVLAAAARGEMIVCLVKPQFEVGRALVGHGGVVRDVVARQAALDRITEFARGLGCALHGRDESPITGPAGNVEYLLALVPPSQATSATGTAIMSSGGIA